MSNVAIQAFIAFLRCEALQSEERAKSLRATAAAIEGNSFVGCTRAATTRKRRRDRTMVAAKSRHDETHSAYTFFVHESLELIRKEQTQQPSREILSLLARQWGAMSEEEKHVWKFRAEQSQGEPYPTIPGVLLDLPDMDNDTNDEENDGIGEENGGKKRQGTRRDEPRISL